MNLKLYSTLTFIGILLPHLCHCQLLSSLFRERAQDVDFFLYNNAEKFQVEDAIRLDLSNVSSLQAAGLRPDVPLKILVHGFKRNHECLFPQIVKDRYFEKGYKHNIVIVDWSAISSPAGGRSRLSDVRKYFIALSNLSTAGRKVRDFIITLQENGLNNLTTTHLIGFSLGAHLAGHAADGVAQNYPEKIGRITGLDPAGPRFRLNWNGGPRRLHKDDARFTDIIHTNMGITPLNTLGLDGNLGLRFSIGHADFFVNGGGPFQPGCHRNSSCSHAAAHNYFVQSIGGERGAEARACLCDLSTYSHSKCQPCTSELIPFGDAVPHNASGDYYLDMTRIPIEKKYVC